MSALGIPPEDVRWVVLSHLHTDHAGGLAPFASAEVIVPRLEWERASGVRGRVRGYLPQEWPAGLAPRLVDFEAPPVGPFAGSHDVVGDGNLLLVPTPGHTPGHAALLVRGESQTWLLGGDLAHDGEELADKAKAIDEFCARERVVFLAAHDRRAGELPTG